jgi:hypothetical protein
MNDIRREPGRWDTSMRWMARLLSLAVNSVFLFILILAATNEDKPQGPAITVLALLAAVIVASFAAWRWERVGGALAVAGGLCLAAAAYSASQIFGLGSAGLLSTFLYGAPFVLVGMLFWVCGQRTATGPVA